MGVVLSQKELMTCRACGFDHPPMMLCGVAKRLRATNEGVATNNATNGMGIEISPQCVGRVPVVGRGVSEVVGVEGKTRNRRTRESYNAYQREYMKRYRAKTKPA